MNVMLVLAILGTWIRSELWNLFLVFFNWLNLKKAISKYCFYKNNSNSIVRKFTELVYFFNSY